MGERLTSGDAGCSLPMFADATQPPMSSLQIDAIYQAFVDSLPQRLRRAALELPFTLKLAPTSGVTFSQVFSHQVTLGAPLLVAEAFPRTSPAVVRWAEIAHCLSIIEAFGRDRLADDQVRESPELSEILAEMRTARNRALDNVYAGAGAEPNAADERTYAAICEERSILNKFEPVSFELYARVSLGKQAVGFPASLALARAAGAAPSTVRQVELALTGTWLGLQFEDDVVDWEDDWRGGGAWAVCLARGLHVRSPRDDRPTEPDLVRRAVLATGVLRQLLEMARRRYRAAWRHSQALGAIRLAKWAREREARLQALIPLETTHAGYTVRAQGLRTWAAEVLT